MFVFGDVEVDTMSTLTEGSLFDLLPELDYEVSITL